MKMQRLQHQCTFQISKRLSALGWLILARLGMVIHSRIVSAYMVLLATGLFAFGDTVITNFTESELQAAVSAGGKVTFSGSGTIVLQVPITVTNEVSLDGSGVDVKLSGNKTNRVFNVETNVMLSLKNISIVDGRSTNGGAIYNSGRLALFSCTFSGNRAIGSNAPQAGVQQKGGDAAGGAIYSLGALVVSNCTFTANLAAGESGWIAFEQPSPIPTRVAGGDGTGGAIYVRHFDGLQEIRDTLFSGNRSFGGGGGSDSYGYQATSGGSASGGALSLEEGRLSMVNCSFASNSTRGGWAPYWESGGRSQGGAVHVKAGDLAVARTRFNQNSAIGGSANHAAGGAVANQGSLSARECGFSGNSVSGAPAGLHQRAGEAHGGALYSSSVALLEGNTFSANEARGGQGFCGQHYGRLGAGGKGAGGAIYNSSVLRMLNDKLDSNTAEGGNGDACRPFGSDWAVTDGGDTLGGGLCNAGQAFITNCTFVSNKAQGGLGGKPPGLETPKGEDGQAIGGGIANLPTNSVSLYNCVLRGNCAEGYGGQYKGVGGAASTCALYNCTVTDNLASEDGAGVFESTLYNCIVYFNTAPNGSNYGVGCELNYSCSSPMPTNGVGNIVGPPLFVSNGDLRLTAASPCIDAGTDLIGCPTTDILGNTRFIDGNGDGKISWDIGAYEFNSFKPPRFSASPQLTSAGWNLNVSGPANKQVRLQRSGNLRDWENIWSGVMGEGVQQVTDNDTGQKAMFYRAVVQ